MVISPTQTHTWSWFKSRIIIIGFFLLNSWNLNILPHPGYDFTPRVLSPFSEICALTLALKQLLHERALQYCKLIWLALWHLHKGTKHLKKLQYQILWTRPGKRTEKRIKDTLSMCDSQLIEWNCSEPVLLLQLLQNMHFVISVTRNKKISIVTEKNFV